MPTLTTGRAGSLAPAAALVGVTAIWGSTFVVIKDLTETIPVTDFLAVRFAIAAAGLWLLAPRSVGRLTPDLRRKAMVLGLAYGAAQLLQSVAAELRRKFPDQIIGIEGHTDNSPTHSQQFPSNHHLSAAQALSVYNSLMQRGTIAAQQLFVIGHGANHPVVSNATDAGRARNRRVEFVVYPERMASR